MIHRHNNRSSEALGSETSPLSTLSFTSLMPFLRHHLPKIARRRISFKVVPGVEIGTEGWLYLYLPPLSSALHCRIRIIDQEEGLFHGAIVSWAEGHEKQLWTLVGLAWQMAQALGHPAFQKVAAPEKAETINVSALISADLAPSTSSPNTSSPNTSSPNTSSPNTSSPSKAIETPAPKTQAPEHNPHSSPIAPPPAFPSAQSIPEDDDDDFAGVYRMARSSSPSEPPPPPSPEEEERLSWSIPPGHATSSYPFPKQNDAQPPSKNKAPFVVAPPKIVPKEATTLSRKGLPLVLAELHTQHKTGNLNINVGHTKHVIRFEAGQAIQITQEPGLDERIFKVAAHGIKLDWAPLIPHLQKMKESAVPEKHLLDEWVINTSQASRLLRRRVLLQMTALLPLGWRGEAIFEETPPGAPLLGAAPVLGIPLPRLIWAALRAKAQGLPLERIQTLQSHVQSRQPRWAEEHTFPLSEIRASSEEMRYIAKLQTDPAQNPTTFSSSPEGRSRALNVFWCLSRLGFIQVRRQ